MDGPRAHKKAANLEPQVVDWHGGGDRLGGCGVCDQAAPMIWVGQAASPYFSHQVVAKRRKDRPDKAREGYPLAGRPPPTYFRVR